MSDAATCTLTFNLQHLTESLAQFNDLWDALYPKEQFKLLGVFIAEIIYNPEYNNIEFEFKANGDGLLM